MLLKQVRRAAAVARKRLRRAYEALARVAPTAAETRRRLIEAGHWARRSRRARPPLSAEVVTLPRTSSGSRATFSDPAILILQLAHIGDFVLSLRAVRKLREGFHDAEITLVCAPWNVDWAKRTGFFDHVVAFDFFPRLNADWNGVTDDLFARFSALPLGVFDVAVDLRHDADTRRCLYRVRAELRAGYAAAEEPGYPALDLMLPAVELLPRSDGREHSLHAELRFELLADAVVAAYSDRGPHPIAKLAQTPARPFRRDFAIMAVGAGDAIRQWPQARFVEVGRRLVADFGLRVVVVGGAGEKGLVEAILAALPEGCASACVDAPLVDLAERVGRAAALVGLGSGITHLAAALSVPTVAVLSGVSSLDVWRPVGRNVISLVGQTPCSPCGLKREQDCPFDVACLHSVSPAHVLRALGELGLAKPSARETADLAPRERLPQKAPPSFAAASD